MVIQSYQPLNATCLVVTGKANKAELTAYVDGKKIWSDNTVASGFLGAEKTSLKERKEIASTGNPCPNGIFTVGNKQNHHGDELLGDASVIINGDTGNRTELLIHRGRTKPTETANSASAGCIVSNKWTAETIEKIAAFKDKKLIVNLDPEKTDALENKLATRIEAEAKAKALAPKYGNDWA
jgi:hypothetical protein